MPKPSYLSRSAVTCILLLATVSQPALCQHKKKNPRYPLQCVGISVGKSTDADVQRRFGKGYFARDEGHLGGRYFVDPKHSVTLHTEIGTDNIIDAIEYQQGVHLPVKLTPAVWKQATATKLTGGETVQGRFGLGALPMTVYLSYGKPAKNTLRDKKGAFEYRADLTMMAGVLDYEAHFRFQNNRLVSISLYNGE